MTDREPSRLAAHRQQQGCLENQQLRVPPESLRDDSRSRDSRHAPSSAVGGISGLIAHYSPITPLEFATHALAFLSTLE